MSRYAILVDAGASKTAVRLIDTHQREAALCDMVGPPASLTLQPQQSILTISQLIADALGRHRIDPMFCDVAISVAGISNQEAKTTLAHTLSSHPLVCIESDAFCSALGANGGDPVNCVAIGTGSVGVALGHNLSHQIYGGWGLMIGDAGSGAWLGKQAVIALVQDLEAGRLTSFTRAIATAVGENRSSVLHWLKQASATEFATLAPTVMEHQHQSGSARDIIEQGCNAIVDLLSQMHRDAPQASALLGGLSAFYQPLIVARCQRLEMPLIMPKGDALDGALHLLKSSQAML